jgi:release factor glutamine methyltransferase
MSDDVATSRYRPMMSEERADKLREWHENAIAEGRREQTLTLVHLGWKFVVPPEVYAPHPLGLAEIIVTEVRDNDRVLDMGTGSGVNAIAAATRASYVLAVDVNPVAVACTRTNAELNGLASRIEARESDVFESVSGRFDLVIFDPPFRWFRPHDLWERGTADENYAALTTFFRMVGDYLAPAGRIILSFGTTGDIDYLHHLINEAHLEVEELRKHEGEKDGLAVAYFAYRLTPRHSYVRRPAVR